MNKKKIVAFVLLGIVVAFFSIVQLKFALSALENSMWFNKEMDGQEEAMRAWLFISIICFLTSILIITVFLFEFVKIFKHSNASNFVRYTYEEYKEYREKKKAEKQAKKRAKLQEQQEKLNKQLQEMGEAE